MPGALNLERSPVVQRALELCLARGKISGGNLRGALYPRPQGNSIGEEGDLLPGFEKGTGGGSGNRRPNRGGWSHHYRAGPRCSDGVCVDACKNLLNQEKADELAAAMCLSK